MNVLLVSKRLLNSLRNAVILTLVSAPLTLLAQEAGLISGRVGDETGAGLPGVLIEARRASRVLRQTSSDRGGHYELSGLAAGTYDISFRLSNLAPHVKQGIAVHRLLTVAVHGHCDAGHGLKAIVARELPR